MKLSVSSITVAFALAAIPLSQSAPVLVERSDVGELQLNQLSTSFRAGIEPAAPLVPEPSAVLQTRGTGGVRLIEDVADVAGTSTDQTLDNVRLTKPTWRDFVNNPHFQPEVERSSRFKTALELAEKRVAAERDEGPPVSEIERLDWQRSRLLLNWHATRDVRKSQKKKRKELQEPLLQVEPQADPAAPSKIPSWVFELPSDVWKKLRYRRGSDGKPGRFDLSELLERDWKVFKSAQVKQNRLRKKLEKGKSRESELIPHSLQSESQAGTTSATAADLHHLSSPHVTVSGNAPEGSRSVKLVKSTSTDSHGTSSAALSIDQESRSDLSPNTLTSALTSAKSHATHQHGDSLAPPQTVQSSAQDAHHEDEAQAPLSISDYHWSPQEPQREAAVMPTPTADNVPPISPTSPPLYRWPSFGDPIYSPSPYDFD